MRGDIFTHVTDMDIEMPLLTVLMKDTLSDISRSKPTVT